MVSKGEVILIFGGFLFFANACDIKLSCEDCAKSGCIYVETPHNFICVRKVVPKFRPIFIYETALDCKR
jgi:hypothetical protein